MKNAAIWFVHGMLVSAGYMVWKSSQAPEAVPGEVTPDIRGQVATPEVRTIYLYRDAKKPRGTPAGSEVLTAVKTDTGDGNGPAGHRGARQHCSTDRSIALVGQGECPRCDLNIRSNGRRDRHPWGLPLVVPTVQTIPRGCGHRDQSGGFWGESYHGGGWTILSVVIGCQCITGPPQHGHSSLGILRSIRLTLPGLLSVCLAAALIDRPSTRISRQASTDRACMPWVRRSNSSFVIFCDPTKSNQPAAPRHHGCLPGTRDAGVCASPRDIPRRYTPRWAYPPAARPRWIPPIGRPRY